MTVRRMARGRVFAIPQSGRKTLWCYEVIVGEAVVLCDNTCNWGKMLEACRVAVAAVQRVTDAGHVLRPYKALVDEEAL